MRFNEIREELRKQPFEPFQIRLSTGDAYVVRHPEFAALTRSSVFVGTPTGRNEGPDRLVQIDLLHVVAIEPTNGRPCSSVTLKVNFAS